MSSRSSLATNRFALLLIALLCGQGQASLDLGYRNWGVSLGNAPKVNGVRINAIEVHGGKAGVLLLSAAGPDRPPPRVLPGPTVRSGPAPGRAGRCRGHRH